jgi:hypothetical protein
LTEKKDKKRWRFLYIFSWLIHLCWLFYPHPTASNPDVYRWSLYLYASNPWKITRPEASLFPSGSQLLQQSPQLSFTAGSPWNHGEWQVVNHQNYDSNIKNLYI